MKVPMPCDTGYFFCMILMDAPHWFQLQNL